MSLFGFVSLVIFAVSVAAMILHFKIMKHRGAVDENFAVLDNVLREIIEEIYENTDDPNEREICENMVQQTTQKLIKTVRKDFAHIIVEETSQEIAQIIDTLNAKIDMYNAYISKFPMRQMAGIFGLSQEKNI